jgi:uracil-DNA glycosylase
MITSFFAPKRALAVASDSTDDGGDGKKRQKMTNPEVEELLSYLQDHQDDNDSQTWYKALEKHTNSASFIRLAKFVATERKSQTVFPTPPDTFSALNLTPLKNVKVVIVGQDPYHGPNQGHGLSFSVRKGVKVPPSLKNIYKELSSDPNVDFPGNGSMPNHGYLERWAKQGVLMLNAVLTVRQGSPNSHGKKGWENFTDEVIRVLVNESAKSNKGLVFLLWGKPASSKAQAILGGTSSKRHAVICTSHPSPLGATKTNTPFLGSKCFSRANDALKEFGMEPIDWNVDGEIWSKK